MVSVLSKWEADSSIFQQKHIPICDSGILARSVNLMFYIRNTN